MTVGYLLRTAVIASALTVSACVTAPLNQLAPTDNRVTVVRRGPVLHLTYQLDREAEVWAFTDSALTSEERQPWRPQQWRVLTDGVVLDRAGNYDVLRTVDGSPVPRVVEIAARPRSVDLEAEYRTLVFTNGAMALPNRQVNLFPVKSLQDARDLPADLNGVELATPPIEAVWRDEAGRVHFGGMEFDRLTTRMERSYVLMGNVPVTRGQGVTAVIDPQLPDWLTRILMEAAPSIGGWFKQRLGPAAAGSDKPVIMAAWKGADYPNSFMQGSVMPGLITMVFEGAGIAEPDDEIGERALWFIGHEAAHFWLGQTVKYEYARDAWITEGGADLMAVRVLKATDASYNDKAELQREIDDCINLARQPVLTARERGEHRAYYACGAVFGMAAEAAQKRRTGGDFLDFVRETLRRNDDGVVNEAEWFKQFEDVGGSPQAAQNMRKLLHEGSADPAPVVAAILADVGVTLSTGRVTLN